jgi:hypothetical protein
MRPWLPRGEFAISGLSTAKFLSNAEAELTKLSQAPLPSTNPFAYLRVKKTPLPGFSFHAMRRTATKCPWLVVKATVEETSDGVRCVYRTQYSTISLFLFFGEAAIFLLFPVQVLASYIFGWRLSFAWWEYGVAALSPAVWYWLIQDGRRDAERAIEEVRKRVGE